MRIISSLFLCSLVMCIFFFFSSRRRHTRSLCDWSSDVCSSDLGTSIPQSQGAPINMQRLIPRSVNGTPQESAPGGVKSTATTNHIAISGNDVLGPSIRGALADEITNVQITSHGGPVCCGPFGQIQWADEDRGCADFIRANAEVIGPVRRILAAAFCVI